MTALEQTPRTLDIEVTWEVAVEQPGVVDRHVQSTHGVPERATRKVVVYPTLDRPAVFRYEWLEPQTVEQRQ